MRRVATITLFQHAGEHSAVSPPKLESMLRWISAILVPFAENLGETVFWGTLFIANSSLPAKLIRSKANVWVLGLQFTREGTPMLRQYETSPTGNNLRGPHPIMGASN